MSTTDKDTRKARHVAWARARLRSAWGKAQLRKNLEAGFRAVMDAEVGALLDAGALARLADHVTSDPVLTKTLRPLIRAAVLLELARLREEPSKLGAFVSDEARALVDQLLERPDLVSPKLVEEMLAHRAFEEIARDVLDDALREFSERVDPFRAEWGIPSLLKLGGPLAFGLGAFAKTIDAVREEFQKRLEPERKRFLQGFAKRALKMVAEFVVKRSGEPQFVALRRELFAWLLEQPVREVVAPATPEVTELGERIGHATARHVYALEATKQRRRAGIDMFLRAHGKQKLRDALATYGAEVTPDFDALTEVLWPLLAPALEAPEVGSFFDELIGGYYDEEDPA